MKKKLISITGKMRGRTKIVVAIFLLLVSIIAVAAIFNRDNFSGGISVKASPILEGEGNYNTQSGTSGISVQELGALNHMPDSGGASAGGAGGTYNYGASNNVDSSGCQKCDNNIICSCKCL